MTTLKLNEDTLSEKLVIEKDLDNISIEIKFFSKESGGLKIVNPLG